MKFSKLDIEYGIRFRCLQVSVVIHRFIRNLRLKHGWYKHQCPVCKMIYNRWTDKLLERGETYADGLCKECYQRQLEDKPDHRCPVCQIDNSVYARDWDWHGGNVLYKCKNCGVKFCTDYDLQTYDAVYFKITEKALMGMQQLCKEHDEGTLFQQFQKEK